MATTKNTTSRRESHNAKRASRFEAAGVNAVTALAITKAVATCDGYSEDGEGCCLCDHAIKWLFRLTLTLGSGPSAQQVTFSPVGSQCILDWAEALPINVQETVKKAVKGAQKSQRRMQAEMRKAKAAAKNRAVVVAKLRGEGDEDGAKLMERFLALPEGTEMEPAMQDIGAKVIRYGSFYSDRQQSFFASMLNRAEGKTDSGRVKIKVTPKGAAQPAQAPQAAPVDPDAALIARARELEANGASEAMRPGRGNTMADIAGKGERWGLSNGQRSFLQDLVSEAEGAMGEATTAPTPVQDEAQTYDPSLEYDTPF